MNTQSQVDTAMQQVLELHLRALLRTDPQAIDYWSKAAEGSLIMAGLALTSLFALLAIRRGENSKPRFLEIPIAGFLALSCLGWIVYFAAADTIAECLLLASQLEMGEPGENAVIKIRQAFEIGSKGGMVGLLGLGAAIALSGFLRNFLLGICTVLAVAAAGFYVVIVSALPVVLFSNTTLALN